MSRPLARRAVLANTLLAGAAAELSLGRGQAATGGPGRLAGIGIASRHLQWTSIEEAAEIAARIGFAAIEWSVRSGAHVEPDAVERDLPRAVQASRRHGLRVDMISANLLDAADPLAERILKAAAGQGISLCRGAAAYRWTEQGSRQEQLDAVRRKVAGLESLNRRCGTALAFHTYSGAGMIGGNLWDLWLVLRDLDPACVGFNYDVGHGLVRNGNGWRDALAMAAPYVRAVSVKDVLWQKGARGWQPEWVPLGEGMVDLVASRAALAELGGKEPVNLQVEHHGLLGTDVGKGALAMPVSDFERLVAADLQALRGAGFATT